MLRFTIFTVSGLTLLAAALLPDDARACSPPYPGLQERTSYPASGAIGVPLNTRVLVRYRVPIDVAARANIPTLGSDLEIRPRGGAPVAFTHDLLPAARSDFFQETVVVARPSQALAASTEYELVDRRAKLPCLALGGASECALGAAAVFATFSTGSATDVTPPPFTGLRAITTGALERCDSGACCGPYVARLFGASWFPVRDEVSGDAVLYNLYRPGQAEPVARFVTGTSLPLNVSCSGSSNPLGLRVPGDGPYFMRALDWAGNEDGNMVTASITNACDGSSPDGGTDGSSDGADTGGTGDAGAGPDVLPTTDGPTASDAAAVDVHAPNDAPRDTAAPAPRRSSGGGCTAAPGSGSEGASLILLSLVTVIGRARRRLRRALLVVVVAPVLLLGCADDPDPVQVADAAPDAPAPAQAADGGADVPAPATDAGGDAAGPVQDAFISRDCTAVGCSSGMRVTLPGFFARHAQGGPLGVTACLATSCASGTLNLPAALPASGVLTDLPTGSAALSARLDSSGTLRISLLLASEPAPNPGERREVRLTITSSTNVALLDHHSQQTVAFNCPNGVACGPICASVDLTIALPTDVGPPDAGATAMDAAPPFAACTP